MVAEIRGYALAALRILLAVDAVVMSAPAQARRPEAGGLVYVSFGSLQVEMTTVCMVLHCYCFRLAWPGSRVVLNVGGHRFTTARSQASNKALLLPFALCIQRTSGAVDPDNLQSSWFGASRHRVRTM